MTAETGRTPLAPASSLRPDGRVAVVTGASRGIGAASASRWQAGSRRGRPVHLRRGRGGADGGGGPVARQALPDARRDTSKSAEVEAFAGRRHAELGGLDIWSTNAAGDVRPAVSVDTTTSRGMRCWPEPARLLPRLPGRRRAGCAAAPTPGSSTSPRCRYPGRARAVRLHRREGCGRGADQDDRPGARGRRDHRERRRPRRHRHPDERHGLGRRGPQTYTSGSACTGSGSRRTSPTSWRSSPPARRATSPARRSSSTAG